VRLVKPFAPAQVADWVQLGQGRLVGAWFSAVGRLPLRCRHLPRRHHRTWAAGKRSSSGSRLTIQALHPLLLRHQQVYRQLVAERLGTVPVPVPMPVPVPVRLLLVMSEMRMGLWCALTLEHVGKPRTLAVSHPFHVPVG